MRKATFILMFGMAVAAIAGVSSIKWKSTSIDLGKIAKEEVKELSFEFTNSTGSPISILEAKGSCGCTKVKFPEGEIAPGATASVTANFSSGKVGVFKKNIRIKTTENDEYTYLYFKGEVVE